MKRGRDEKHGEGSKKAKITKKETEIVDIPVDLICIVADALLSTVSDLKQSFEIFEELEIPEKKYFYCLKSIFRIRKWPTDFKTLDEAVKIAEVAMLVPYKDREDMKRQPRFISFDGKLSGDALDTYLSTWRYRFPPNFRLWVDRKTNFMSRNGKDPEIWIRYGYNPSYFMQQILENALDYGTISKADTLELIRLMQKYYPGQVGVILEEGYKGFLDDQVDDPAEVLQWLLPYQDLISELLLQLGIQ